MEGEKYTPKHKAGESIYFDGKYHKILCVDDYTCVMYQLEFGVRTDAKKADEMEERQLRRDAGDIDKAKELALKKFCVYDEEIDDVTSLLTEMARWKQEQVSKKAVKWLEEHITEYASFDDADISDSENKARFFDDFEKAMDEYEHPKVVPESIKDKAREIARDYAPTVENADAQTVIHEAVMEMAKWLNGK